ncbi:MAG: hypothetical protein DRI65_02255 [Chloroflexota bacterium]|nr:MAG: hypothetical protein DRI65_02255 [Chloroflexota bacterium]
MLSELGQGLTLSGVGILITFSALALLIGLIVLLKALFPPREEHTLDEKTVINGALPPSQEREKILKQAAAVGVSVLVKKMSGSTQGNLGKLLEDPVGGWWRKGVDRVQGKEWV